MAEDLVKFLIGPSRSPDGLAAHRADDTARGGTAIPERAPLLPIDRSPEARAARAAVAREAVARMRAIRNEPGEDDGEFLRELDEANAGRFELGKYWQPPR